MPIALEAKYDIHEVFEKLRTGKRAVFRHVSNEDDAASG